MKLFSFCVSEKVFVLPLFLINILLFIELQVDHFFSFSVLKTLFHCLLACNVSSEESAIILIFVPMCIMCVSSLFTFKIFSLSLILSNLIMIWCGIVVFVCLFFIYLFLAALGFCCCARALSSCGSGGHSLLWSTCFSLQWLLLLWSTGSRHAGFSSRGSRTQQLWLVGSRAQAQQLCRTGPVALRHVGSSRTRARTRVPCISRRILNHCAAREAPVWYSFLCGSNVWSLLSFLICVYSFHQILKNVSHCYFRYFFLSSPLSLVVWGLQLCIY